MADQRRRALAERSSLRVRPVTARDRDAVAEAFSALSEESRYLRYLGTRASELSENELRTIVEVDHDQRETLLAVVKTPDRERVVGVARYVRLPEDPTRAELAIVVADEHQGQGIGRVLLDALSDAARERGVTRVCAEVLAENRPMLALIARLGEVQSATRDGPVREIEISLPSGGGAGQRLVEALRAAAAGRLRTVWQEGVDPVRAVLTAVLGGLRSGHGH